MKWLETLAWLPWKHKIMSSLFSGTAVIMASSVPPLKELADKLTDFFRGGELLLHQGRISNLQDLAFIY